MTAGGRGRRGLLALLPVVLGLLVWLAAPASAHSELARSDPPDGGMVAVGRTSLGLWFAEPVAVPASSFVLRTVDGRAVPVEVLSGSGGVGDSYVALRSAPLERGRYVLDWRVVSPADGHPSSGSLLFGAGTRPEAGVATREQLPGRATLVVRWLDLASLLVAIGAAAVGGRVLARVEPLVPRARRRALAAGAVAAAAGLAAGAVSVLLRTPRGGSGLDDWLGASGTGLVETHWGRLWLLREAALLAAVVAFARLRPARGPARGPAPGPAGAWLLGTGLLVAAGADVWAGHAADLERAPVAGLAASFAHLVAAGVWAGGLVVMAWCLLPTMRRAPALRRPLLSTAWRAFSPWAAVSAVVLVATGLYEAGRQVPDLGAAVSTAYGGAVVGKLVLVLLALVVAGLNTLVVNPGLAARARRASGVAVRWRPVPVARFPLLVAVEVAVLAVAVGLAALATSVPTAREQVTASAVSAPRTAAVDGLFVTFEALPAGAGESLLVVRVSPTVRPQPGPVTGVDVLLVGPGRESRPATLRPVEPGRYETTVDAPATGRWTAWIAVQRPSVPDAVTQVGWAVAAGGRDPVRPLERVLTSTAVLLLGAAGVGVLLVRRRTDRGRAALGVRDRAATSAPEHDAVDLLGGRP